MGPSFKEEFSWRNLSLGRFHKAEAFCEAQWRWPGLVFVLYRSVMCGYTLFGFTYTVVTQQSSSSEHFFLVFLTNWTYLAETVFFLWGLVLAAFHLGNPGYFSRLRDGTSGRGDVGKSGSDNPAFVGHQTGHISSSLKVASSSHASSIHASSSQAHSSPGRGSEGGEDPEAGRNQEVGAVVTSLPWYVQAYWFLSNVLYVNAFVVTVVYFVALYTPSHGLDLDNLNVHALNSVMLVVDVCVCARPVRVLHALYPFLYGLSYVFFSVVYWSQDRAGNVLYENVLDWNEPGIASGVVVGLGLVADPLLHLLQYGVYRLRLQVFCRVYGEGYV